MNRLYYILPFSVALSLAACVDDKGSNERMPINEVEIEGMEENYYKIAHSETLTIPVEVKGSISGKDDSQYNFEWFYCNGALSEDSHKHVTISKDKDLVYPLDMNPGTYKLYLRVTDKGTGMAYEKSTTLTLLSPFVRGFYLFGDKEDGTCGLDFVSMVEGRDTSVVVDIFDNKQGLKDAENLIFSGAHPYDEATMCLWMVTKEGSYALEHSSTLDKFSILKDKTPESMIFPTVEVERPIKIMEVCPHALGLGNTQVARSARCIVTTGETYFSSLMSGEAYGNPISCYSAGSSDLVKLSPYVFYAGNSFSATTLAFYDLTNHCFVKTNAAYYSASNIVKISDSSSSPFSLDQTTYNPVRDLVYGENGRGNSGRSYALMKDADGSYFIYMFLISGYGTASITKSTAKQVDKAVAIDFDQASHYAFYSEQPIVFYSVGADLWAYNYNTNKAKKVKTFEGEITYLAMDANSDDNYGDFIVATYSASEKGTVRKFEVMDDPNDIMVSEKEYKTESYPWKTNLKVVKVEYRNSTY